MGPLAMGSSDHSITKIAVIGNGLMGTGIAQVAIEAGFQVTLVGRTEEKNAVAKAKIQAGVTHNASKRYPSDNTIQMAAVEETVSRLRLSCDLHSAVSDVDLVLESIVENLKVKQKIFEEIAPVVPDHCILATNTSSLQLRDIVSRMEKVDRFAGLHFFNPVSSMRLVELVSLPETSEETISILTTFCRQIGKVAVQCTDTAGFIVNRLLVPYLLDAIRMAERGDASLEDIDKAIKFGTAHPMGPFQLCDHIGLDTLKFVIDGWHQQFPHDQRFSPCALLDEMVADGKLGKKVGEGFYTY